MTVDGSKALRDITILIQSNWLPEDAVKAFEQSMAIIKANDLDRCGDGVTITLEDGNELSPHVFEDIEVVENARVTVSRCINCGKIEIGWERK